MKIKPLADNVVIKQHQKDEITIAGIVLPESQERKGQGEVVAVGTTTQVSVGDTVLFEKWGGEEVEVDGEEYKIISVDKILAILCQNK